MKPESAKTKIKKRPIKVVYPYMCPFCEDVAYPANEREIKALRLPDETIQAFKCGVGHTFYVREIIVKDQEWAEDRCNKPALVKKSKDWKKQLRAHDYGVDD